MNTELRNKAWSILPKEFKEEVNEIYINAVVHHPCGYNHKTDLLKYLFGNHNLTSDAEGEEMLCVKASKVREMYALNENILYLDSTHKGAILLKKKLTDLFGSKCLPDVGPKPAEPTDNPIPPNSGELKSQEADKHFDSIHKDGFSKERRLNIAAILAAGMLASEARCYPVDRALELADKLITECKS